MLQRDEEEEEEEVEAAYLMKSETDLVCTTRSVKGLPLVSGLVDGALPHSNDLHLHFFTYSIIPPALPTLQKTSPHFPPSPFSSIFTPSQSNHSLPGFPPHHLSMALLNKDEEEEEEEAGEAEEEREEE